MFLVFFILFLIGFTNCIKTKKEDKFDNLSEEENLKIQNEKINQKNDSSCNFSHNIESFVLFTDSFSGFTYELQDYLIEGKNIFHVKGDLLDVYRKDLNYVFEIETYCLNDNIYIAEVLVSQDLFEKIKPKLNNNKISKYGCFLIKVDGLEFGETTTNTQIDLYLEGHSETSTGFSYFDMEEDVYHTFLKKIKIKGELINCYFYEENIEIK